MEAFPKDGSLNVPTDVKPYFQFAQNVDRSSFMQAISITPYMSGQVKYDWSGYDEVQVQPPEKLRENTTYVVTLAKDLKTMRGGTLTSPFQIVFSTGASIDSGIISGKVYPSFQPGGKPDLTGVYLFAYDLSKHHLDTLDLTKNRPDYLTQPGKGGEFEFRALAIGQTYRIIAVADEFHNKMYVHTADDYGVAGNDIELHSHRAVGVTIRMSPKVDTSKPILQDVEVRDAHHLRATFSEPIDTGGINEASFSLRENGKKDIQTLVSAYRENPDKKPAVVTLLTFDPLERAKEYSLEANPMSISDKQGNIISDTGMRVNFVVPEARPDTFPAPRLLSSSILDSIKDVDQKLRLKLRFSDVVLTSVFDSALKLATDKNDPIQIEVISTEGNYIYAISKDSLKSNSWYILTLAGKEISSPLSEYFDKIKDTVFTFHFKTRDLEETGVVKGTVTFNDTLFNPAEHRIGVEITDAGSNFSQRIVLSEGRNNFSFPHVPRGKYKVHAWLTSDPEGSYDGGSIKPFRFAMPSGEYSEEIDVRPRWTVENVNIDLR